MGKFCCWYKEFPSTVYIRVDDYISGGFEPEYITNRKNALATFNLKLQDRSYDDILNIKTGDDICITENETATEVKGNGMAAGKINERSMVFGCHEPLDSNNRSRKQAIHEFTVEQRNFSTIPFDLDFKFPIMLSDLLNIILQEHTRGDLGGVIQGQFIPKFILQCDDVELVNYTSSGLAMTHVEEAVINRAGLKWKLRGYCEPSETNGINVCYQVIVYA